MSVPDRFGRYVVRRRLGSGAFATVWLAHDEHLDSPVAIKVLADNWTDDLEVRRRFVEEGRFLRKVESPHVVSVYDAGELDDGRPYLVMTYADAGTLADRAGEGALPLRTAVAVISQIGAGLSALHDRGVLHRDIKPANVLFRTGPDGVRAMVGDLGLGKSIDTSSRLTIIAGTPSYVSPEQALGVRLDPRTDQYSLAALAYLVLTGRPAYAHLDLLGAAHPGLAPPMTGLDPRVEDVVRRGLSISCDERWPTVRDFTAALEESLREVDPEAPVGSSVPLDVPGVSHTQLAYPSGAATSKAPISAGDSEPTAERAKSMRWLPAALAVLGLSAGSFVGFQLAHQRNNFVAVTDDSGTVSVTIPRSWQRELSGVGWVPPGSEQDYPALSIGSGNGWREAGSTKSGVFLGILPAEELPDQLPQHLECQRVEPVVEDVKKRGDVSRTVVATDCPGVVVERVIQVTANRLLWVQVRSADRGAANAVLDSVAVHGM